VRALPVDTAVLDGEAIVFRPVGHSDFMALRTTRGAAQASLATFCSFKVRTGESCRLRFVAQLDSLVAGVDAMKFSEAIEGDGAIVFAHSGALGLEGVISKRRGGVYSSGRCRNWVKVRSPTFERRWSPGAFLRPSRQRPRPQQDAHRGAEVPQSTAEGRQLFVGPRVYGVRSSEALT
jgi:hypothetical protein